MYLAIDLGGTHLRYVILNTDFTTDLHLGTIHTLSTQSKDIIRFIEELLFQHPIKQIGISFAGQVENGVILSAPNLQISHPNIQEYFAVKYNITLQIDNDLKCASLAEYSYWQKPKTLVAASIGTGFGSAMISDGGVARGAHNLAGEIGHIPFRYSPLPCGCGNHYCVEASCSGLALQKQIEFYGLDIKTNHLETLKSHPNPNAKKILENFHEGLLHALGTVISLLNPEVLVLGGGVIHKNPYLIEYICEYVPKYTFQTSLKQCRIVQSQLKDASLRGALLLHTS